MRKAIPAVIIFLLLTTATLIQANAHANQTLRWFWDVETRLKTTTMEFGRNRETEYTYSRTITTVYGLYDLEGNLLPYPTWEETYHVSPADRSASAIVVDTMEGILGMDMLQRDKQLDKKLAKWVSEEPFFPDYDLELIKSNIFSQTFAFTHRIEVKGESYYLALYYRSSPLSYVFFQHTAIFYLFALFVYGIIFALSTTKGYGFQVWFMRQYGGRGNWNDAIIHIDEKTGKGTMLTKQWGGMSNLMNSDYRDKE